MEQSPEITKAVAGDDYTVYAYFTDGTVRLFNVKPFIGRLGLYASLSDEEMFRDCLTVMHGTVAWDLTGERDEKRCIDLDPLTIYENSTIVDDPLA